MENKKKFYLTTAIAYTSSKPHIGNVYESILADAIVRYKRKDGYQTYFMTGTDEHGQKIERKAASLGITPQQHVDNISNIIKETDKLMNISYDKFIRTTDDNHMKAVQNAFELLYKKGDIYKGKYSGLYCVACETYWTEKDLNDGKCPDCGGVVEETSEECYFLKLTPYQERLVNHIKNNPEFIQPESRKNEMLNNFLKNPLPDLCVSRSSYTWGIPVKFDPKHVTYVWIDALLNYVTGIGWTGDGKNSDLYNELWPADVHLIGKDILRFHTIYWPIILMALDMPLPKQVFGHPWILTNHNKMSKSKGNVIYADDLTSIFGVDAVRYYCLHEIPFASDGNLTYELVCERTNSDLANTYGNLVKRTISMVIKYFGKSTIYQSEKTEFDENLENIMKESVTNYKKLFDEFKVADGLEETMKLVRAANKYIDETMPWSLAKDEANAPKLMNVLYHLLEAIRISTSMLEVAIPETANKVYASLNTSKTGFDTLSYGSEEKYQVNDIEVLFPRFDVNKVMDTVLAKEEAKAKEVKPEPKKEEVKHEEKAEITIDDFDKLDLAVGEILEAKKHPDAEKLLVFKVDLGTEVRQIVSGIAKFYKPEELVGKKVIVVKNLKPRKLRGLESHGMLLCASDSDDTRLELVNLLNSKAGDIVC